MVQGDDSCCGDGLHLVLLKNMDKILLYKFRADTYNNRVNEMTSSAESLIPEYR